tara:strand:- start:377 stop:634 length:258 start_codon:yes stop_codon:yes gene_type:complete
MNMEKAKEALEEVQVFLSDSSGTLLDLVKDLRRNADKDEMTLETFRLLNHAADELEKMGSHWKVVKTSDDEEQVLEGEPEDPENN